MTDLELKGRAYDLIAMIEACKTELGQINMELAQRAEKEKPVTKLEKAK